MRKNIIEIAKSLFAYNRANLLTVNNLHKKKEEEVMKREDKSLLIINNNNNNNNNNDDERGTWQLFNNLPVSGRGEQCCDKGAK